MLLILSAEYKISIWNALNCYATEANIFCQKSAPMNLRIIVANGIVYLLYNMYNR